MGDRYVTVSNDKSANQDRPSWLDQIMGTASPAFSFRRGGSMITNGDPQQSAANQSELQQTKGRQRR
jgi:hypothetical protein